jgi:hypothetical protein
VLKLFPGGKSKNLTQRTQRKEEGHREMAGDYSGIGGMKLDFTANLAARILKVYVECER